MSIPKRPANAVEPQNPTIKIGPKKLKIRVYLPKVNGFKAMVYVEGTLFHCNTLGQQPCYYLTKDLSEDLQGLQLDDENAIADYTRGGFLEVYVPLIGSPDQIAQVRAWNDMEETQRAIQARKEQKRQREEEIAKNGGKKPKGEPSSQRANKKSKKQKSKGSEASPRVDTNKQSTTEATAMAAIADSVSKAAEQKVQKSQAKLVAKQEWIQQELKKKDEKRKKKRIVADTLKSNVEQAVKLKLSKEGQNQAKKQKKQVKKAEMKQVAAAAQKKKKSVKFG